MDHSGGDCRVACKIQAKDLLWQALSDTLCRGSDSPFWYRNPECVRTTCEIHEMQINKTVRPGYAVGLKSPSSKLNTLGA